MVSVVLRNDRVQGIVEAAERARHIEFLLHRSRPWTEFLDRSIAVKDVGQFFFSLIDTGPFVIGCADRPARRIERGGFLVNFAPERSGHAVELGERLALGHVPFRQFGPRQVAFDVLPD
jgi:hypothetical protein